MNANQTDSPKLRSVALGFTLGTWLLNELSEVGAVIGSVINIPKHIC